MTETESPTLDTPVEETPVEETAEAPDVDTLVKELEKAGVTTTKELQGKLTASKEAGQLANLLGDANKRIADLEKATQQKPVEQNYDYSESEPVDIEAMLNSVMDKREAKTRQVQQQAMAVYGKIQNDEDMHLVKDVWDAKVKDPTFNMDIQSGRKNITDEYAQTVRQYYKGIAKQSLDTITALQKGVSPTSPHVEGEAALPGMPETPTGNEKTEKALEKVNKGGKLTQDEEMEALNDMLRG